MFKTFRGNKKPYLIRLLFAIIFFAIASGAFLFDFKPLAYVMSFSFVPAFIKTFVDFSIITLLILIVNLILAFVFGRFYCSVFCPLGILQDIIGTAFFRKSGKTPNLFYIRYTILAFALGALTVGAAAVFRYLDPYSTFGNLVTGFVHFKEVSLFTFVPLVVLAVFVLCKNRIFCTSVCPAGTILGLCSRFGLYKMSISKELCKKCGQCEKECPTGAIDSKEQSLDNERCIRCMRCVAKCPGGGILFEKQRTEIKFEPSRRNFITTGVVLAVVAGVLAKGKDIAQTITEAFKKRPILPPGAVSPEEFAQKCTNCGLCVEHCKGKILKKPDADYETVHIDFSKGSGKCEFDCKNCSDICPTGAIKKMTLEEKQNCRIGLVKLTPDTCSKCGLCAHVCPKGALEYTTGQAPKYNAAKCIGCGACQKICPTHSVEIVSINKQSQL